MTEHLELTDKLNRMSALKHFDAYDDVDWDAPENAIDAADPRWELGADDPLGGSAWYRALPQPTRARFGLHRAAASMKVGWQFESVLKRGLLELRAVAAGRLAGGALPLPRGDRGGAALAHVHGVRAAGARGGADAPSRAAPAPRPPAGRRHAAARGPDGAALPRALLHLRPRRRGSDRLTCSARRSAPGASSIRSSSASSQIHVTEEARHIGFARSYLRDHVPELSPRAALALALAAPVILGLMAKRHAPAERRSSSASTRSPTRSSTRLRRTPRARAPRSPRCASSATTSASVATGARTPSWRHIGPANHEHRRHRRRRSARHRRPSSPRSPTASVKRIVSLDLRPPIVPLGRLVHVARRHPRPRPRPPPRGRRRARPPGLRRHRRSCRAPSSTTSTSAARRTSSAPRSPRA